MWILDHGLERVAEPSRAGRATRNPASSQSHCGGVAVAPVVRMSSTIRSVPAPARRLAPWHCLAAGSSAWLSARHGPASGGLAKVGRRRCTGLGFQVGQPWPDQLAVRDCTPLFSWESPRSAPLPWSSGSRVWRRTSGQAGASICGWGLVRWRTAAGRQGPFVEPRLHHGSGHLPLESAGVGRGGSGRLAKCGLAAERMAWRQIAAKGLAETSSRLPRKRRESKDKASPPG